MIIDANAGVRTLETLVRLDSVVGGNPRAIRGLCNSTNYTGTDDQTELRDVAFFGQIIDREFT